MPTKRELEEQIEGMEEKLSEARDIIDEVLDLDSADESDDENGEGSDE